MKKLFRKTLSFVAAIAMIISVTFLAACSNSANVKIDDEEAADQILYGNVITMDENIPEAKAVAVKNGRIIFVGATEDAKSYLGKNTKVLDYGENYIYPGFLDAHEHGLLYGWRTIGQANLGEGQSYDDYVTIFKKYVEENPGRDYYMASGWVVLGEPPTHELLDKVSTDIPLIANSGDGHSMLLNKKAMEICELDKNAVNNFAPGEIKVDKNGEPTGLVSEEPAISLAQNLPFTKEDVKSYLLEWQKYAFAHGYTGGAEGGSELITKLQDPSYTELAKEGKLKFRTYSYATIKDNTDTPEEDVEKIVETAKQNDSEFYKTIGFKVFLDGVLEANTSWMYDEYKNKKGYYGVQRFRDHDKMVRLITAASKYNMGVHAHSVGDGATKFMLDCIEDSQKETGNLDQRNACAHLQHVRPEDFSRFASTNTVAVTPPIWVPSIVGIIENEITSVGSEKAMTDYPIGSFFKVGAPTVFHSDYPAGFMLSAPASIYMAKNRTIDKETASYMGVTPILRGPNEKISGKEALLALTKNVAYLFHEEDNLGSIEIGKCADFSIFPCNFLSDEPITYAEVMNINPVATIVAGDVVYENK